jgi:hypothetical protein
MKTFNQLLEELGHTKIYNPVNGFINDKQYENNLHITNNAGNNLHSHENLTPEEIHSIKSYIAGNHLILPSNKRITGYTAINGHLRGTLDHPREVKKHIDHYIKHMDSAIAKHTTEDEVILPRGSRFWHKRSTVQADGTIVHHLRHLLGGYREDS